MYEIGGLAINRLWRSGLIHFSGARAAVCFITPLPSLLILFVLLTYHRLIAYVLLLFHENTECTTSVCVL